MLVLVYDLPTHTDLGNMERVPFVRNACLEPTETSRPGVIKRKLRGGRVSILKQEICSARAREESGCAYDDDAAVFALLIGWNPYHYPRSRPEANDARVPRDFARWDTL